MSAAAHADLESTIEAAFDARDGISPDTTGAVREAVEAALGLLDRGEAKVATRGDDGSWTVHQWLKKAVLLSFRLNDMEPIAGGPGGSTWWDKVPSKFDGWDAARFREAAFARCRAPSCAARPYRPERHPDAELRQPRRLRRRGARMVDTWATVGSCAQIGAMSTCRGASASAASSSRCRPARRSSRTTASSAPLRGGRGLHRARGLGARHGRLHRPVDQDRRPRDGLHHLWRGAALFRRRRRLAAGKAMGNGEAGPALYCAVIVKRVDERTRSKTSINDLLRA